MTTMSETVLIGVAGYQRSGKSTAAAILGKQLNSPVIAFADPIKDIVSNLDPYDSSGVRVSGYGGEDMAKAMHDDYRNALRAVGEGVRKIDDTFWARTAIERVEGYPVAVVQDVRFPLEAGLCGLLLWIQRPGVESDGDETERDLSKFAQVIVVNDGTERDLEKKMESFVEQYVGERQIVL